MGILFRYVLREIAVSSLIGGALFTFVLFLKTIGPVMELLVRATIPPSQVGYLFLLTLPQSLPYTIPWGVLAGVLIGLGRLSTDGEVTAVRSAGIPSRSMVWPVGVFCLLGAAACAYTTLDLSPWALRQRVAVGESLKISQASAKIQPRVFIEKFPNTVVYVRDIARGDVVRWKGLFLADTRAPEVRGSVNGVNATIDGPRITVAEEAVVVPRPEQNRLQVHMPHASTFEQSFDPKRYQISEYNLGDHVIDTNPHPLDDKERPFDQMTTSALSAAAETGIDAAVILQQRYALPLACLVLPMVGIPLSISTQRAGKSVGFILTVILAFVYWMLLLGGTALATEGDVSPVAGVWLANVAFALGGLWMLSQLDSPSRRDYLAIVGARLSAWFSKVRGWFRRTGGESGNTSSPGRLPGPSALIDPFVPIVDRYILRKFLFYFLVILATFVSLWFVFSFFELLSDMLARQKLGSFIAYIYYLTPFLVYETAPFAVMVATLVLLGILAKHQELIAFRACGVSMYRLAAPLLLATVLLSGGLFALDHYYLPETNRRQDAIRDEIKGRPARTFLRPDRQWTHGQRERIFYHRYFDWDKRELAGVNVYDFGLEPFRLTRVITADKARWDSEQATWIFQKGWVREIAEGQVVGFEQFEEQAFEDIAESPEYFRKEERQHQQMNWRELQAYILDLTQSGFDTVRLQVMWHRKFSFPVAAFAMALLGVPFAVLVGSRGALAPVAFSLGLGIAYYALTALFEQLGIASQLTPALAAWAPAMLFCLSGTYLLLRVRT